jgi:ketosteroid isomerase-like protein
MKTTMTAITLVLALIGPAMIGPAMAADDAMSVSKQIGQTWIQAAKKGDAAVLTSLYTKDAILFPQGVAEPVTGEANIRKFFDEMVAAPKLDNLAITEAEAKMVDPKTVFVGGTWSGDSPGQNGGASVHVAGTWLAVDVLEGSAWKIRADAWNMMPPPSAQPATAAAPSATMSGSSTPKN